MIVHYRNGSYAEQRGPLFLPRCMHCIQRGLATRKRSVRSSVKRVDCDKTEERSAKIFIPYERKISLVL